MQNNGRTYRYERKFLVSDLDYEEVESIVRLNPGLFSEIFYERWVNNIYFDTHDFESYAENEAGALNRTKMRIRWYGELLGRVESPLLEFKTKQGFLGSKSTFPLAPFSLDDCFCTEAIVSMVNASEIPDLVRQKLLSTMPALVSRYRRKYFQSADGHFRMTLDRDQQFYGVNAHTNLFLHRTQNRRDIVVELKYDQPHDDQSASITRHLPFALSKSSKYMMGVDIRNA
jgi:SPX domain protein involved in polyphosphate accumulation